MMPGVVVVCRRRRKYDDQSVPPEYPGPPTSQPTGKEETPPPKYCPPDNQLRANRISDKSGYADLGLAGLNVAGEPSLNRSLHRSPRHARQSAEGAPVGYVNRTFIDDAGMSDEPTRGRRRSSGGDDSTDRTAGGPPVSSDAAVPKRKTKRSHRSSDDPTSPRLPSPDDVQPGKKNTDTRPDDGGFPHEGASGMPSGSHPGDRSFEIINPGYDVEDSVPEKRFDQRDEGPKEPISHAPPGLPRNSGQNSAFDRLFPRSKPVPTPRSTSGSGSHEDLAAAPPRTDARLNRSFDPSSYLPDRSLATSADSAHQGSAPDVRQRTGNTTIQFNTAAQAIDV